MTGLNKEMAHRIWELLEAGVKPYQIDNMHGIGSERTNERLQTVLKCFKDQLSVEDTAKKVKDYSEARIRDLFRWWIEYLRAKYPVSYHRHIGLLMDLADRLRNRIVSPEVVRQPYTQVSAWQWPQQDWRLSPAVWFTVMTPYLEDEKLWGPLLPCLKKHLGNSSPFWEDYRTLENEAKRLEAEYQEAAKEIAGQDPTFGLKWKEVNDKLRDWLMSDWLPDIRPSPAGDMEQEATLPYTTEFCRETMKAFARIVPDLEKRLSAMERQLQQLWDDLDPDVINPLIEWGSCPRCPGVVTKPTQTQTRQE